MAAAQSPDAILDFLRELLSSRVFIIPSVMPTLVNGQLPPGQNLQLSLVSNGERNYVPFYSSPKRLPQGSSYLSIETLALFQMTKGSHLVLNPGAEVGKEFTPEEVESLLEGALQTPAAPESAQEEEQVQIGEPNETPTALLTELTRFLKKQPSVFRAWLALYHQPSRQKAPGFLVAFELREGADFQALAKATDQVVRQIPKLPASVDFVRYNGKGLSGYFTKQKPFYSASLFKRLFGRN